MLLRTRRLRRGFPDTAKSAIDEAAKKITSLKDQYYDISKAMAKIADAKEALDAGDYVTAENLAKDAVALAQPPYSLYGGVVLVIIIAVAGVYWYSKRRRT